MAASVLAMAAAGMPSVPLGDDASFGRAADAGATQPGAPSAAHGDDASPRASSAVPAASGPVHRAAGAAQVGLASYYGRRLAGRRMADGTPMRPESDNAASRTLPLGSSARVTNLGNGRTALVTIRDRGPHARGRIIDLSLRTAAQLDLVRAGVARVEVVPVKVAARGPE